MAAVARPFVLLVDDEPPALSAIRTAQEERVDIPVLPTGPAGSGKAQMARAMPDGSLQSDRLFVELNLAGIPDDLAMIDLFEARRGVPRAGASRSGPLQEADRGTLFLNGIDAASPGVQMTLARVLREGALSPVGGHETPTCAARLMARSERNLRAGGGRRAVRCRSVLPDRRRRR